jgi:hypothetical protein
VFCQIKWIMCEVEGKFSDAVCGDKCWSTHKASEAKERNATEQRATSQEINVLPDFDIKAVSLWNYYQYSWAEDAVKGKQMHKQNDMLIN